MHRVANAPPSDPATNPPRLDAPPATAAAPTAQWQTRAGGTSVLTLAGDWRGSAALLPAPPPEAPQGRVQIDASALQGWDARLASALWQCLKALHTDAGPDQVDADAPPAGSKGAGSALTQRTPQVDLAGLPPGLQQILKLSLPPAHVNPDAAVVDAGWLGGLGQRAKAAWGRAEITLGFVGEVLLAAGALLRGKSDMRGADLAWQVEQTGPRSVAIVSLVSLLVSLILAYMGAAQLELFGAAAYTANLVTVGVVREIAALVTGIILAGRVGAAFAAQIASMQANEEIDALRTLGVDPIGHLVLPRVLAMALMAPLLTAYAALVGSAVGLAVAVLLYDVSAVDYLLKSRDALSLPHVLIGLFKGTVYGVLVALAGCREGLAAGRSAQAVGEATTAAVVKAIVWIALAASLLTIIFQRLDW